MPLDFPLTLFSSCSGARYHAPALHLSKTQDLRVLAFSSHSFDASLIDMLTVLMVGGCICIPDEETRLNNLAGAINDLRVNWATLTPTVVRFLEPAMVPGLETIVLAGEPMSQSNLDPWSRIVIFDIYLTLKNFPLTHCRISSMHTVPANALWLLVSTPTSRLIAIRRTSDFLSESVHGLWIPRITISSCQLAVWVNYSPRAQL
jgi:non-ribosomal peptide synthetase component F